MEGVRHWLLWTDMNALHTTRQCRAGRIDWAREVKLAVVLSVLAALVAIVLAGRVSDRLLVTAVIVAASAVAWSRIEPAAQQGRVPARRR